MYVIINIVCDDMKKVINTLLILLLVIIPFPVSAEDNCSKSITIKNIELVKLEGK